MRRQRQLNENAMNGRVRIQLAHQRQQIRLRCIGGQRMLHRMEAALLGGPALGAHIDLTGRIFPDQHHGQARLHALGGKHGGSLGDFTDHMRSHSLAIDGQRTETRWFQKGIWCGIGTGGHFTSPALRPEAFCAPTRFANLASGGKRYEFNGIKPNRQPALRNVKVARCSASCPGASKAMEGLSLMSPEKSTGSP